MASDEDKKKAQELVDEASELLKRSEAEPENKTQIAQQVVALMNKAIALDEENDGAWNHRGLAKAYLDEHQNAINDLDEAIKFNPKNDMAWNNRGFAKYHLGQYEEAIKDFNEALRLNPNNEHAKGNRLAAESALRTKEESKKDIEDEKEHLKKMEDKSKLHADKNRIHHGNYEQLFIVIGLIIAITLWVILKDSGFGFFLKNPFAFFPVISVLVILSTPFIWLIRINIREANKHHTLQEYYYSRYIVELYFRRHFTGQNDNKRVAENHMNHWMVSPPSELLIRLDPKSSDHSDIPQMEMIKMLSRQTNTTTPTP
jgi:tetratricopeptide (TPR) repeat protein